MKVYQCLETLHENCSTWQHNAKQCNAPNEDEDDKLMSQSECLLYMILLLQECYWLARDAKEPFIVDRFLTSSCSCSTSSLEIRKGMSNQRIDRLTRNPAQQVTTRNSTEVRWDSYWVLSNPSSFSMNMKSSVFKWRRRRSDWSKL